MQRLKDQTADVQTAVNKATLTERVVAGLVLVGILVIVVTAIVWLTLEVVAG